MGSLLDCLCQLFTFFHISLIYSLKRWFYAQICCIFVTVAFDIINAFKMPVIGSDFRFLYLFVSGFYHFSPNGEVTYSFCILIHLSVRPSFCHKSCLPYFCWAVHPKVPHLLDPRSYYQSKGDGGNIWVFFKQNLVYFFHIRKVKRNGVVITFMMKDGICKSHTQQLICS